MTRVEAELTRVISHFLGPRGILSRELAGYEYREEQVRMAEAVLTNLQEGGILMVEAGTGTGKTLAYLLPALLSNRRVIISTGTKTLQEQIFYKDLALMKKHFQFRAVMMKGRANYLCWRRFQRFLSQPKFEFSEEAELVSEIRSWSERTKTGDREELVEMIEGHPVWQRICSDSELCLGSNCPHFRECFITGLKSQAQNSDLIVVNHHLFFADLSLRRLGFGEVLPRYNAVIFDEAHLLEDIIADYFGISLSDRMILSLSRDLLSSATELRKREQKELLNCAQRIENLTDSVFSGLRKHLEMVLVEEEARRIDLEMEKMPHPLMRSAEELSQELAYVSSILADKKDSPELESLAQRAGKQALDLKFLLRQDEPGFVYYAEIRSKSLALRAVPIQVADLLREILYPNLESIIFTSATLTVCEKKGPSFNYFKSRMGLEEIPQAKELWLKSSFSFQKQALLFLPQGVPDPDDLDFVPKASAIIEELVRLSQGRAFLLFTSYKNLGAFYKLLCPRLKYPVLCQGEKPRSELLREFREVEESVLFATTSFWQGVDVVGPALSLVVIDRLPFDSPGDPLIKARITQINQRGGNAFFDYQVPSAVIMLRQGLGRLIRSTKDRGVLSILDPRIEKRNYGKVFLASLPEIPLTHKLSEVAEFFAQELG